MSIKDIAAAAGGVSDQIPSRSVAAQWGLFKSGA